MQRKLDRLVFLEILYFFFSCIAAGFCVIDLVYSGLDRAIAWGAMAVAFSSKCQSCNMRIRMLNGRRYEE